MYSAPGNNQATDISRATTRPPAFRQQHRNELAAWQLHPRAQLLAPANRLRDHLVGCEAVRHVAFAGGWRRGRALVRRLDLLASSTDPRALFEHLGRSPLVRQQQWRGDSRIVAWLEHAGLRPLLLHVHVASPATAPIALLRLTGSPTHVDALERLARLKKLDLDRLASRNADLHDGEQRLYNALGLPWIPPELREDRGEIEAARDDALPALIARDELRGDLGCPLREAADLGGHIEAACRNGLDYLVLRVDAMQPRARHLLDCIRARRPHEKLRLVTALECPLREDGRPAADIDGLPADQLHVQLRDGLDAGQQAQTRRLLAALEDPRVTLLSLPGRVGQRRYPLDMERILEASARHGVFVELDPEPSPLLPDIAWRMARERGAVVALCSAGQGAESLETGLAQARRAWMDSGDVANARAADCLPGPRP